MTLPEGQRGPVGPTGPIGPAGAPVSAEMREKIMADVEAQRPIPADEKRAIFATGFMVGALLILFVVIAVLTLAEDNDHDVHGVPCTISEECK